MRRWFQKYSYKGRPTLSRYPGTCTYAGHLQHTSVYLLAGGPVKAFHRVVVSSACGRVVCDFPQHVLMVVT